jgi:hypothetical protein
MDFAPAGYSFDGDLHKQIFENIGVRVTFEWRIVEPRPSYVNGSGYATLLLDRVEVYDRADSSFPANEWDEVRFYIAANFPRDPSLRAFERRPELLFRQGVNQPSGWPYVLFDGRIGSQVDLGFRLLELDTEPIDPDNILGEFDITMQNLIAASATRPYPRTVATAGRYSTILPSAPDQVRVQCRGSDANYVLYMRSVAPQPPDWRGFRRLDMSRGRPHEVLYR